MGEKKPMLGRTMTCIFLNPYTMRIHQYWKSQWKCFAFEAALIRKK